MYNICLDKIKNKELKTCFQKKKKKSISIIIH